jgi:DNA-binding NarL/FixJ family response regulator
MHESIERNKNIPIRIAVVEDHTIVRQALANMLAKNKRLEIIIEAENGQDFLDQLAQKEVDVVLLDYEMPLLDGRSTLTILQRDFPAVRSIMLSMFDDPWIIASLISEGAKSYLKKNCTYNELIHAVIDVFEKGSHHNELVTNSLIQTNIESNQKKEAINQYELISRDEIILTLICDGKTSVEIADLLFLSKKSIDAIRTDLLKRFGATNSANLVSKCMLLGLYKPRSEEEIKAFEVALKANRLEFNRKNTKEKNSLKNEDEKK